MVAPFGQLPLESPLKLMNVVIVIPVLEEIVLLEEPHVVVPLEILILRLYVGLDRHLHFILV